MIATYEQALSRRDDAHVLLKRLTGARPVSVGVTKLGQSWAVKVGISRLPVATVPDDIDGVPLIVDLVAGAITLGSSRSG